MSALQVTGVSRIYGEVIALEAIDLSVPTGSRTVIVGHSGSGKTTLLRIIAGFEVPDAGQVTLDGAVLVDGQSFTPAHKRSIGFVAQDGALFPHLSIADNIGFGLARNEPNRAEIIAGLMDSVDLNPNLRERRPHQLSGGQQQRVALARALARQPKLMLLDEPFSALDTGLRESTRKTVGNVLRKAGITTILVTHDQSEALSFADQVAVLREGRLVQAGTPQQLYLKPVDQITAAFLGDAIILPAELGVGWAQCALGRIAADSVIRFSAGDIMLRPEQMRLTPVLPGNHDPKACLAEVLEVEFGGAVSTIGVRLVQGGNFPVAAADLAAAPGGIMRLRYASFELPAIGSLVSISVSGKAHVFDRR